MMLLPNLGAVLTVVLGFLGLLFPKAVGRVLGIDLDRPLGTSEFRATYGGFFLSLGIGCIVAQSVQVFTIVGAAWCSAAIVRMVSCAVDNVWTSSNLAGVVLQTHKLINPSSRSRGSPQDHQRQRPQFIRTADSADRGSVTLSDLETQVVFPRELRCQIPGCPGG